MYTKNILRNKYTPLVLCQRLVTLRHMSCKLSPLCSLVQFYHEPTWFILKESNGGQRPAPLRFSEDNPSCKLKKLQLTFDNCSDVAGVCCTSLEPRPPAVS